MPVTARKAQSTNLGLRGRRHGQHTRRPQMGYSWGASMGTDPVAWTGAAVNQAGAAETRERLDGTDCEGVALVV
jgi:hypothetical protein